MAEFLESFKVVEKNEGGYVSDPSDRGGETYQGISRRFFPTWKGWKIVDAHKPLERGEVIDSTEMTSLVRQFYRVNFWDTIKGDYIDSQKVATFLFDWHVNSGSHAIKAIQTILGLARDRVVGTLTIEGINAANEDKLLMQLKAARIAFYQEIVKNDPTQARFLKGWLSRVEQLV